MRLTNQEYGLACADWHRFLLPTLHLNNLGSTISLRKLKGQLSVLPARLNEIYGADLARILEQPLNKREFAIRIIGWVLHAAEPLSIQGLQHALAVEQSDEYFNADGKFRLELLLETTAGLLTVKETKGRQEVQFFHHSVAEFFEKRDKEIFPQIEQDLAETCVSYLSLKDFAEPCKPEALDKRCQDFPFLRYASMHWGRHVTRCSHLGIGTSQKVQEFIQPESMPLGSLQVIATKVLHLLHPERIRIWKNPTLHMAIICGLDRIVEELINNNKVDLEARGHKDETALHLAARSTSRRSLKLLIRHKANVNATNYSGKNALDMIMVDPYQITLDKLFYHGYDVVRTMYPFLMLEEVTVQKHGKLATTENIHHSQSDNTDDFKIELRFASTKKTLAKLFSVAGKEQAMAKSALIQYLLEANLQMDISDDQESIVKMLIEGGVDVNSQNRPEATPLQLAAIYGRINIVRSLLDHGANPFLKRDMGCTALALARKRDHADIVHVLSKRMEALARAEEHITEEAEMLRHPGPRQAKHLEESAMEPEARWCRVQRFLKMMPPALAQSPRPPAPTVFTISLRRDPKWKKEPCLEQSEQQTDASDSM